MVKLIRYSWIHVKYATNIEVSQKSYTASIIYFPTLNRDFWLVSEKMQFYYCPIGGAFAHFSKLCWVFVHTD